MSDLGVALFNLDFVEECEEEGNRILKGNSPQNILQSTSQGLDQRGRGSVWLKGEEHMWLLISQPLTGTLRAKLSYIGMQCIMIWPCGIFFCIPNCGAAVPSTSPLLPPYSS